ncbi:heme lyase CcmF/NrfE family subunit [Sinosporangium siamense]|uniref:Cytochrome c biogenesis protein CcmF n=1 Tax=Sinosporangium siamense TaxID=1367973 RepID=A0A919V6X8_9ACTN|nr:cytochrome c-type biogenesis CcmF C-terminal domain-containing protein [Sinosporangium siamense]GII94530.1 cytochrome c biogenesis protein CcmF [Sinosporangium siamense]
MISALGSSSLATGLVAASVAAPAWTFPGTRRHAARLTAVACGAAVAAFALLEWALLSHDFRVGFVAAHGGRHVPPYYTFTSLWSGMEGSLVLWVLVSAGLALACAAKSGPGAEHGIAMAVVSVVCAVFFALTLFAADPFRPADPVPADGPGPDPLLRGHPLMGVHPPLLYLGTAGLVVPFAYGVAGLVTGRTGKEAARVMRHWTLVAWIPLTAGIALGAAWSYGVLGWGGYWEWDPVENASLMPWLVATALLHSLAARERRGVLGTFSLTLAVTAFLLVLLGVFLTRGGAVASVHSFTGSAAGPVLLGVFTAALIGAGGLVVWRAGRVGADRAVIRGLSRESLLLGGVVLLAALAFTVLLGTLFPLLAELARGERVSVGPPYFDRVTPPFGFTLLVLMAAAPFAAWSRSEPGVLARRLARPAVLGALTVIVLGVTGRHSVPSLLAYGIGAFALGAVATRAAGLIGLHGIRVLARAEPRRRLGGVIAHAGVAVAAVAIAASAGAADAVEARLRVGESMPVHGYVLRLDGVERTRTEDNMGTAARLTVYREGTPVGLLRPGLTFYTRSGAPPVASPDVHMTPLADLYVAVSEIGDSVVLRAAVNPMMAVLWTAAGALVLGGLLCLQVPARRRGPVPAEREPARLPAETAAR